MPTARIPFLLVNKAIAYRPTDLCVGTTWLYNTQLSMKRDPLTLTSGTPDSHPPWPS